LGLGMAYHKIAQLYVELGRLDEAKGALTRGLEFSEVYNIVMVKYKCYFLFYQIYKQEGDFVNSLKYLELYHQQKETVVNTQTYKVIENYEMLKQMESLEKEARLQLEKAEIIEKKNIAEESARIKQDFLSTMSHEIRTPLNAVITIAALLGEKGDKGEQELLDSLKFASNNLLYIINDILDFTKLDAGKMELERRPSNIRILLDNIKKTYDSLAREKGLQLNLTIAPDVSESYGMDETKLSQILGNLITNAIKFTQYGRVDIMAKKTGEEGESDKILFEVKDTGAGISEANLESVFESFSQGKSTKTRKEGGTGLGLAIVKKLVELHDSRIKLKSALGIGSVFSFELILSRAISAAKTKSRDTAILNGRKVLLAEDNLINAMVIGKLLANWKMEVDHAKNGFEAVTKSQEKTFDYILMDIHMPEMDGYEASQQIRLIEGLNQATPIYALTADITAESQEEYKKLFRCFLHKPIEIDKLHDAFLTK
jgi:signal transduction histidine kinase/BarA-like signal transduction histidine kinase